MSLHIIENKSGNILELEVSGKFVASDFQTLESTFQGLVERYGKIRVLFIMRDFHGWEPVAFWDEVKFDLKHFSDIERLAMVGDKQWEKFLGVLGAHSPPRRYAISIRVRSRMRTHGLSGIPIERWWKPSCSNLHFAPKP